MCRTCSALGKRSALLSRQELLIAHSSTNSSLASSQLGLPHLVGALVALCIRTLLQTVSPLAEALAEALAETLAEALAASRMEGITEKVKTEARIVFACECLWHCKTLCVQQCYISMKRSHSNLGMGPAHCI